MIIAMSGCSGPICTVACGVSCLTGCLISVGTATALASLTGMTAGAATNIFRSGGLGPGLEPNC